MAHWSTKRMELEKEMERKRKADALASKIAARIELFKTFRLGGWEIAAVEPGDRQFNILSDTVAKTEIHFRVKPPGAYPMRIRSMDQILRLVKGVQ
jgi:hypothetical protein